MPIDQVVLKQCIGDIEAKVLELRKKQENLMRIKENLQEAVILIQQIITDQGQPETKSYPRIDKRTGKVYSDETLQKIYDDNFAEATIELTQ